MCPMLRVLVVAGVRLGLIFFAGWFAFADDALGAAAPLVSHVGLVLLCLVASILVGEVDRVRTHFGLLVGALRAAGSGGASGAAAVVTAAAAGMEAVGEPDSDPRVSVDILVRALGTADAQTREKAHRHLVRLTGKRLPAEVALWERWWQENRAGYRGPPANEAGNPDAGP